MRLSGVASSFGKEKRDKLRLYHPDFKYDNLNGETESPGPAVYDPLRTIISYQELAIFKANRRLDPKSVSLSASKMAALPGPDQYYSEIAEKSIIIRDPQPAFSKAPRRVDMRLYDSKNLAILERGLY